MIIIKLVPFYIAKRLYELGYDRRSEYHYPVTQRGEQYKSGATTPFIAIESVKSENTTITEFKCGTDFKENRLTAPSFYEVSDWLLEEHNILIEVHSYNSRGDYNKCKWIVDINKKPLMVGMKKRKLYDTRFDALCDGVELSVNKIYSEKA